MSWNSPRKSRTKAPFRPSLETLEDRVVPNNAPVLTLPAAQFGIEGDSVSLLVQASDADSDSLTFSAVGLPAGLNINPSTGLITGFVGYGHTSPGGTHPATASITVSDGIASDSGLLEWTYYDVNRLPYTTAGNATEGQPVSLDMHGTDNTGTNALTYSSSGLPPGLSINASTGLIGGVPGYRITSSSMAAFFTATVTLSDDHGGTDVQVMSWSVNDAEPLSSGLFWSGSEGATASLGTAAGSTSGLTFSASGLPQGLTINPTTGVIGGVVGYANATLGAVASVTATVTVSDAVGLLGSAAAAFTLTNTNRTPTALPDSYVVRVDNAVSVHAGPGVLSNDTDTDGDSLSASVVSGPSHGTLTLAADGSFL